MHGSGIVFHIADVVEELGREQGLGSASKANLRLGEASGAITACSSCGRTYATVAFGTICPHLHTVHEIS